MEELTFYMYGPWFHIADYYVRSGADERTDAELVLFLSHLITESAISPLPTKDNAGAECSIIAHGAWSEKYSDFYRVEDPDGNVCARSANIILPRTTVAGVKRDRSQRRRRTLDLFQRIGIHLLELAWSTRDNDASAPDGSSLDHPSSRVVFDKLLENRNESILYSTSFRLLQKQTSVEGPFDRDPGVRGTKEYDRDGRLLFSDVMNPVHPDTLDDGIITRLKQLQEDVFHREDVVRVEQETHANGFSCMPPIRGDNRSDPGVFRTLPFSDSYIVFRKQFYQETMRIFLTQCLRMHLNAVHYMSLFHRGVLSANRVVYNDLRNRIGNLDDSEVEVLKRMPIWSITQDLYLKQNPIEKSEGYQIQSEIVDCIMSEMEDRTNPFVFASILSEVNDPSFLYNIPPTFDEVRCLFLLILDAFFSESYYPRLLEKRSLSATEENWVLSQMERLRSSSQVEKLIFELIELGRLKIVGDGEAFWDTWIGIHHTPVGEVESPDVRYALDKTHARFDLFVQKVVKYSERFENTEIETIKMILEEFESLVFNRYLLWMWTSSAFYPLVQSSVETSLRDLLNTIRAGNPGRGLPMNHPDMLLSFLYDGIGRLLTPDPLQRVYFAIQRINTPITRNMINVYFRVPEIVIDLDIFEWGNRIGNLMVDSRLRKRWVSEMLQLVETQYMLLIMNFTYFRSFYSTWIRPTRIPNPQASYVFAVQDRIREERAFDKIVRRVSHLTQPVHISARNSKEGRIIFVVKNWPWLRRISSWKVSWALKARSILTSNSLSSSNSIESESGSKSEPEKWHDLGDIIDPESDKRNFQYAPITIEVPTGSILRRIEEVFKIVEWHRCNRNWEWFFLVSVVCEIEVEVSSRYDVVDDRSGHVERIDGTIPFMFQLNTELLVKKE